MSSNEERVVRRGQPVSRRRLLQLMAGGAAGLAVAAACSPAASPTPAPTSQASGQEKPAGTPSGATPQATAAANPTAVTKPSAPGAPTPSGKAFNGAWPYQLPPAGHWNSYVANANTLGIYWDLIQQPLAMYYWANNDWMPLLATDWKIVPPDTFEVTLRQGVKWSDGSDFTARDVIATFQVGRLFNWTVWNYIDRIEASGDHTVTFHMSKPSTVVPRYILRERIRDYSTYGKWSDQVEALVNAGKNRDSEEWKKLFADFEQFRPQEMVASGPFKVDQNSMTESQLTLVKIPTAWNASAVGFDQIVLFNGETPTVTPIVLARQVDYATHGFPPATEKAFIDQGLRVLRPPTYAGPALLFNYATMKAIAPKEVRQAIAHAFRREDAAAVALGASAVPPKSMAGFSDHLVPQWMSEADQQKLNSYPYDPAKAESLLLEIGYTKGSDGVWVSRDGERMEYDLSVPAEFADNSAAAVSIAEQLTQFGIKTTVRMVTFTQHPIEVDEGKFQMAVRGWGAAHPHPHFSFAADVFTHNTLAKEKGGGMNFPLTQQTSMGELDLEKLVVDSADGLDEDAQKALVTQTALAFNELLPIIPIYERYGNNPVLDGVRVVGWPPDGDPIYANSPYADSFVIMLMYEGKLQPV